MFDSYDPASYKVGDPIFIASHGWRSSVHEYRVEKITPSGQIVAMFGKARVRINTRGYPIGDGPSARRRVVSAESAADIMVKTAERELWSSIQTCGDHIETAARKQDREALDSAMRELSDLVSSLPPLAQQDER